MGSVCSTNSVDVEAPLKCEIIPCGASGGFGCIVINKLEQQGKYSLEDIIKSLNINTINIFTNNTEPDEIEPDEIEPDKIINNKIEITNFVEKHLCKMSFKLFKNNDETNETEFFYELKANKLAADIIGIDNTTFINDYMGIHIVLNENVKIQSKEKFITKNLYLIPQKLCQSDAYNFMKKNNINIDHLYDSISKTLRILHEKKYVHRDIKLENILYCGNDKGKQIYKLIDYGFLIKHENIRNEILGTIGYIAPFIIKGNESKHMLSDFYELYNEHITNPPKSNIKFYKSDEYALACVLYIIHIINTDNRGIKFNPFIDINPISDTYLISKKIRILCDPTICLKDNNTGGQKRTRFLDLCQKYIEYGKRT